MQKRNIRALYYITHIDNLASILERGILSHDMVEAENLNPTPIYDTEIVRHRSHKTVRGKNLWFYANLYFQPRNAMMYRMVHQKRANNLAVAGSNKKVL